MGLNYGHRRGRNERLQTNNPFITYAVSENNAQNERNDSIDTFQYVILEEFDRANKVLKSLW